MNLKILKDLDMHGLQEVKFQSISNNWMSFVLIKTKIQLFK